LHVTNYLFLMVDINKLYADIMRLMKHKEPYLKQDFSLQKLAKLMDSNTTYVSRAINQGAKQSFPNWLAEFRIKKAVHILENKPDISTAELCKMLGEKNPVVMRRQYRRVTGKFFSERKENK